MGAAVFGYGTGDFHSVSGVDFLKFGTKGIRYSRQISRAVPKMLQCERGLGLYQLHYSPSHYIQLLSRLT